MGYRHLYAIVLLVCLLIGMGLVYMYNRITYGEGNRETISFAVEYNVHSAAFWIALDKGYFREYGIEISYRTFTTGLELAVAMGRGDIDVAIACIGPLIVMKARGSPIKLVAMTHLHGYAVVAIDGIDDIRDLDGKTISSSGPGSPTWLLLNIIAEKYGLDLSIHRMPPYMAVNALLSRDIDASALPEHYATMASRLGAHVVIRSRDVWRDMPGSGVIVSEDLLYSRRDVVIGVVKALARAIQFIRENPVEASRIVAKYLSVDQDLVLESMKYLDYTLDINVSSISQYIDYLVKYGAIDHCFPIDSFIDMSILGEVFESVNETI